MPIETKAAELGSILKNRRTNKNLSQKQLSSIIFGDENHNASISRIENGKIEEVKFDTISKILKALDIDLIKLIQNA